MALGGSRISQASGTRHGEHIVDSIAIRSNPVIAIEEAIAFLRQHTTQSVKITLEVEKVILLSLETSRNVGLSI